MGIHSTLSFERRMANKIVLSLLIFVSFVSGECPPGGWWSDSEDRFCYKISEDRLTWGTSQQYCWNAGGHLAEFSTLEQEQNLYAQLNHDVIYWFGLSDSASEGTWIWHNSYQQPSYYNWHYSQPNGGSGANCVMMVGWDGFWYDQD